MKTMMVVLAMLMVSCGGPLDQAPCDCSVDSGTTDPEPQPTQFNVEFKNESTIARRCTVSVIKGGDPQLLFDGIVGAGEAVWFPNVANDPSGYYIEINAVCFRPGAARFEEYSATHGFHVSMPLECFVWYGESNVTGIPYMTHGCRHPRPT